MILLELVYIVIFLAVFLSFFLFKSHASPNVKIVFSFSVFPFSRFSVIYYVSIAFIISCAFIKWCRICKTFDLDTGSSIDRRSNCLECSVTFSLSSFCGKTVILNFSVTKLSTISSLNPQLKTQYWRYFLECSQIMAPKLLNGSCNYLFQPMTM